MVVRDLLILATDMGGSLFVYILASRSRTLYTGVTNRHLAGTPVIVRLPCGGCC
jgi:hypothetical protein